MRGVREQERLVRDVSDYQATVSPDRVFRAGSRALMVKACEGLSTAGAQHHRERSDAAHRLGLRVLHYGFLHDESGTEQALQLLAAVEHCWAPGDRLVADIEVLFAGGAGSARANLDGWRDTLHRAGHRSPLGYTYRGYPYLRQIKGALQSGWIIADYGTWQRPNVLDRLAIAGVPLLGRQFTDGTTGAQPRNCPGISGPVDCTRLTNAGVKTILQRTP
jgi:Glycosyl hydrolases family 25